MTIGKLKKKGDIAQIKNYSMQQYGNSFDMVFMEDSILHYLHKINPFMQIMYSLQKKGNKWIYNDFHPFTKISDILNLEHPVMNYFSTDIFDNERKDTIHTILFIIYPMIIFYYSFHYTLIRCFMQIRLFYYLIKQTDIFVIKNNI